MIVFIGIITPYIQISDAEMKRIQEKQQADREKGPSLLTKILVGSAIIDALDGSNKKEKKDKR